MHEKMFRMKKKQKKNEDRISTLALLQLFSYFAEKRRMFRFIQKFDCIGETSFSRVISLE